MIDERTLKRIKVINYLFSSMFSEVLEEFVSSDDRDCYNLYKEVSSCIIELDGIIEKSIKEYNINRLNKVDLAIIRYATYEMKYLKTPANIAINEAVIITKILSDTGDGKQYQFNNKLLDQIKDNLGDLNG